MKTLLNYAMKKVWCEPIQDRQYTFKPHRATGYIGSKDMVVVGRHRIGLPVGVGSSPDSRYHLYHIGAIDRSSVGLDGMSKDVWVNVPFIMEQNDAIVTIYLDNGALVPLNLCYLKVLADGALVLAVETLPIDYGTYSMSIGSIQENYLAKTRLSDSELFIRFYKNSYLGSSEFLGESEQYSSEPVRTLSKKIDVANDYFVFNSQLIQLKRQFNDKSFVFFADGFVMKQPLAYQPALYLGKTLSVTFDGTVDRIEYHKLSGLPSFRSKLDEGKNKYLVLSLSDGAEYIEYCDDVDFYLINGRSQEQFKGTILNRYAKNIVRQVTHNAWAVDSDQIESLIHRHDFFSNRGSLHLMVVIRKASIKRGIPHQFNEVNELYKLPRALRLEAMTGVNSTLLQWRADELENSDYCKLMGAADKQILLPLVADALGYNVVTMQAEPVIHKAVDPNTGLAPILSDLYRNPIPTGGTAKTVFVYDNDRLLKGRYFNNTPTVNELLPAQYSTDAYLTEIFHATLSETTDGSIYGQNVNDLLGKYWGYRAYVCPLVSGAPNGKWQDVTGLNNYYQETGNGIVWNWTLLNSSGLYPAYRRNGHVLCYDISPPITLTGYSGKMEFTIASTNSWVGTNTLNGRSSIPAGTVDVFMNGLKLIDGLDYHLDWPKIVICKRPLGLPTQTVITIRTYGTCDPVTIAPYQKLDFGFVKGGVLSVNQRYDIRASRSISVNIAGMTYLPDEVSFAENELLFGVTDGLPYESVSYLTPVEPYLDDRTTASFLAKSLAVDRAVTDYMTPRLDMFDPELPIVNWDRYRLFSPFLNFVIHAMVHQGSFADATLQGRYGNTEIETWISSFKYLLAFDPCTKPLDKDYVVVYPHQYNAPVTVTAKQYSFLDYLVRNYLNGNTMLSQSVNIGAS